jgi:hypothetical protein
MNMLRLLACLVLNAPGDDATPRGYVCERASGPVTVDGRLDDEAWGRAAWSAPFVDIEGSVRPDPRFRTRVKMLWDDEFFYVGAEMEEPHVWGTLKEHDAVIFQDNDFEIFLDPDGDNHEYYELEINALNTEWDLFLDKPYRDGGPARNEWEVPGLKTAVHVDGTINDPSDADRGWSVEFAIPWKVLGEHAHRPAPPRDGDRWRINFSRVEWRHEVEDGRYRKVPGTREDNWVWSPQGAIDMHRPERWGYVQFAAGEPGKTRLAPDLDAPARDALMRLYHAQRAFQKEHGRWAATLDELRLPPNPQPGEARLGPLSMRATGEGFEGKIEISTEGGGTRRWRVEQDSRLTPVAP